MPTEDLYIRKDPTVPSSWHNPSPTWQRMLIFILQAEAKFLCDDNLNKRKFLESDSTIPGTDQSKAVFAWKAAAVTNGEYSFSDTFPDPLGLEPYQVQFVRARSLA